MFHSIIIYSGFMEIYEVEKSFSAIGQETRIKILSLLASSQDGTMSAGDISLALGVPQNTLSFHLSHLENADMLTRRRAGRFIIYGLNARKLDALILYMAKNFRRDNK